MLERRTQLQVSSRRFKILVFASLIAGVLVWVLYPHRSATDDDRKLQELRAAHRWGKRIDSFITGSVGGYLPSAVVLKLRLGGRQVHYREKANALEKELLASGYLTNALVTITNLPASATNKWLVFQEVYGRMLKLRGVDYWHLRVMTNTAIVTCRPCDLSLVRDGIGIP